MADYVSEAEALADWEDDNCIVDYDDFSLPRLKKCMIFPNMQVLERKN